MVFPGLAVERAHLARLEPGRNAVEMEGVVARAPYHCALVGVLVGVGLALDARVHDMIPTDRAIVNVHIFLFTYTYPTTTAPPPPTS